MEIIGIDKSLQSMEEAIEKFEDDAGYPLTDTGLAIFQYAWIVSATQVMKKAMQSSDDESSQEPSCVSTQ